MLEPDEMEKLIIDALLEYDENSPSESQRKVLYEITECDYIPYLLRYKVIVLTQPFHPFIGDILNMIDTQREYLQSERQLDVLEDIDVKIEGIYSINPNKIYKKKE